MTEKIDLGLVNRYGDGKTGSTETDSNLQKLAFYSAGIMYIRRPNEGGVILQPFAGVGRSAIAAVSEVKHYACEIDEERAIAFSDRWPDADISCEDNREWLDSGFYASMDVIAVDFDAQDNPFDQIEIFLQHADLEKYCIAFCTWGFRNSDYLKKGKRHTRDDVFRRLREIMISLADPHGVSVKSMGMAVPSIGRSRQAIYSAFSLVKKGGIHAEGEIAGEAQELKNTDADAKPVERLELGKLSQEERAAALARLQFTPAEISAFEAGDPHDRAVLEGEAQLRFAMFNTALLGNPQALKLMAEVVRRRKYQDRVEAKKAQLRRTTCPETD